MQELKETQECKNADCPKSGNPDKPKETKEGNNDYMMEAETKKENAKGDDSRAELEYSVRVLFRLLGMVCPTLIFLSRHFKEIQIHLVGD